jgi:predicted nuclease with RNAse H fold
MAALWAGVDVGGRRKGFHVALVGDRQLVDLRPFADLAELAGWLRQEGASLVAVDSPISPAPDGERSRAGERALVAAGVCSIRYTPDRRGLSSNPTYYEWIEQGFRLYDELHRIGLEAIECFPTASWTRWAGPRGQARRAAWTRAALASQGVPGVPALLSQDHRDAIAAALTARAHDAGTTERFGDIVVPRERDAAPRGRRDS